MDTTAHQADDAGRPQVYGFMHIATHGRWRQIVDEQFELLRSSGLYGRTTRFFVGIVGAESDRYVPGDDKTEVVYRSPNVREFEFPTLSALHDACRGEGGLDGLVYYLHTKGVFADSLYTTDWRRYMEYFVVECHGVCEATLQSHDVCGVNWLGKPWPHFSGNFWWARTDYIRSLVPLSQVPLIDVLDHTLRHNCERWIGSGAGVRAACLKQSGVNHYHCRYPRELYARPAPPDGGRSDARASASVLDLPIVGFMHVAMVGPWRQVVQEQLLKLRASGLWDRTCRLVVGTAGPDRFDLADPKLDIVNFGRDIGQAERPTLGLLQDFCGGNDCLVYYLHTKGVTRDGRGTREWRHAMEHFLILRHRDCIAQLAGHDVCGINWGEWGWCRSFLGNFWWARSDYVRTLPDIRRLRALPGLEPSNRFVCERWIGENPAVRAACLFQTAADHYADEPCPRSRYAQLRDVQLAPELILPCWQGLENTFQDLLEPVESIHTIIVPQLSDARGVLPLAAAARSASVVGIFGTTNGRETAWSLPAQSNVALACVSPEEASDTIGAAVDVLDLQDTTDYRRLREEFERWEPKLRPGGCVLFHNTAEHSHSALRLLQELPGRKAGVVQCAGLGAWYKSGANEKERNSVV